MKRLIRYFFRDVDGASAVEFVLAIPVMLMMTIGVINASLMLFTVSTLHYATEEAVRWCMINSSSCDNTAVTTQGRRAFGGMATANFVVNSPANCIGTQVTGAATYTFITGFSTMSVPLSATVCRPAS